MRLLSFMVLLLFSALAFAQSPASGVERLSSELEALGAIPSEGEAQAERRLSSLREMAQNDIRRLASLQERLQEAPQAIAQMQSELARLKAEGAEAASARYAHLPLSELEEATTELNAQMSDGHALLGEANSLIIAAQTRPERAQADIGRDQARLQEVTAVLKGGRDGDRGADAAQTEELEAEREMLDARLALTRQELAGNSLLHDLGRAQRELAMERIRHAEHALRKVQTHLAAQRRVASERAVAELESMEWPSEDEPLVRRERTANRQISEYLLGTTGQLSELEQRNLVIQQQLDQLGQVERTLDEQISVLQGSRLLARILYQQRESLPTFEFDRGLADRIADMRLYQFEISQQRERLEEPARLADRLLAQQRDGLATEASREALLGVLLTRVELLDRLNHELNEVLNAAITLQLNQRQLETLAERLRATLDEQMFWVPSNRPLSWSWAETAPGKLVQQFDVIPWGAGVKEFASALRERPVLFISLLLVVVAVMHRRRWLYERLGQLHTCVGNVRQDTHWHTPLAVFINFVLAWPGALLLTLAGYALMLDGSGQNSNIGAALMAMALTWLVLYSVYRVLTPGGVAERHFHWTPEQVRFLHRHMRVLGFIVLALTGVVTFAGRQPSVLAEDVLGLVMVLGAYAAMSVLLLRMIWNSPQRNHLSTVRSLLALVLSVVPLGLFVAVCLGYYYTALQLTDRLILTLYVLLAWGMLESIFIRGLAVEARRLAFQRALTKRQATASSRDGGEGVDVIEEPVLGMDQINQQSLRVLTLVLLGLALMALYWIWADVIEVFTYLETVVLYEYTSGRGELAVQVPISLSDVLGALLIVVVAVVVARNLPGLLEVLVLSRIRLGQGSAYAITTLLSYTIISVGTVATLSTLGVSWDKLQWLVAALSVGLGFGLQEIFANFVSGLIILFERPVRIGDVVTIGELSGTVSKIRIRATTIIDFDRKEIIVPNKTFVTSQLINWSLTDTVTRVTLHLRVVHGSDLETVRELLLQIAHDNARVLRDPEPLVLFLNFGDSTLDHELRIHVRELGDRNPAIDEINREVDRLFRERGIEIALRRVDVHLRSVGGLEQRIERFVGSAQPDAPGGAGDDLKV